MVKKKKACSFKLFCGAHGVQPLWCVIKSLDGGAFASVNLRNYSRKANKNEQHDRQKQRQEHLQNWVWASRSEGLWVKRSRF